MRLALPETPGQKQALLRWVAQRIPHAANLWEDPMAQAIGVVTARDTVAAGVVFNEYYPRYGTIQAHVAADTPKWATHDLIRQILAYPFLKLGVNKVWTAMPHTQHRVLRFNRGIGFTREAILSHHFGEHHAYVTRMFARDYRRFYQDERGPHRLQQIRSEMKAEAMRDTEKAA